MPQKSPVLAQPQPISARRLLKPVEPFQRRGRPRQDFRKHKYQASRIVTFLSASDQTTLSFPPLFALLRPRPAFSIASLRKRPPNLRHFSWSNPLPNCALFPLEKPTRLSALGGKRLICKRQLVASIKRQQACAKPNHHLPSCPMTQPLLRPVSMQA